MRSDDTRSASVTRLLHRWREGDEGALEELLPRLYDRLRRMAAAKMQGERADHTLEPTALVHEAYARMVDLELSWTDRAHFLSMTARTMRRVLVDHARAHRAVKRGGGAVRVSLAGDHPADERCHDLLALDEALNRLGEQEARPSRAIELHYFGGLSYAEVAEVLGVSEATIDRDMRFARAWLKRRLEGTRSPGH